MMTVMVMLTMMMVTVTVVMTATMMMTVTLMMMDSDEDDSGVTTVRVLLEEKMCRDNPFHFCSYTHTQVLGPHPEPEVSTQVLNKN